jgi:hypothetical protein
MKYLIAYLFAALFTNVVFAGQAIVDHNALLMDHGYGHSMDMAGGMVMGENKERLPAGCEKISEEKQFTVRAGREYAKKFPGSIFGFDQHEWKVKPCAKVTIEFINEDRVRHQWMMHGLPKNLYNQGMFHLEITGPAKITGTFIAPSDDKTYLAHCDIAQHMEKGMKGQLVVGKGSATFPSIPGISDPVIADDYSAKKPEMPIVASAQILEANTQAPLDFGGILSGTFVGIVLAPIFLWFYRNYVTIENIRWISSKLLVLLAHETKRMLRVITAIIKKMSVASAKTS